MDITTNYGYFDNYALGREGKYDRQRKGFWTQETMVGESGEAKTMVGKGSGSGQSTEECMIV